MYDIDKIFELLENKNLTFKEVAKAIGISPNNFTEWKKGRITPSGTMIIKLANYFGVPIDYFLLAPPITNEQGQDLPDIINISDLSNEDKQEIVYLVEFKRSKKGK
ncbi:MAG TPA: hypothetical protein DCM73_04390 [Clostridiales bacterium]|jgi:transcriptional regulator with XRE-family HTH domain|nr:hypothetical protein [Clostridiales bacterium]